MQITVNEPGARTIRDSRPMRIDGQKVYVVVSENEAALMVGGKVVAVTSPEGMNVTKAQDWAVNYRDGQPAQVADAAAVSEVCVPAVAAWAKAQAADLLAKAVEAEAHGDAPYKHRRSNGRVRVFRSNDPQHPINLAKSYRAEAAVLAAWTARDEASYSRYISDGIGDTDGHFAPVGRVQWKRFSTR